MEEIYMDESKIYTILTMLDVVLSPVCFHNYFTPNSSVHRIGTRQSTRGDLFLSLKGTTHYGLQTV